ncbi:DUF5348 domain-containing protein [Paenibacillus graminis]|uniref:DUF5348 domain-containing protein n=1 Tax=Paenibacillus graminis TaxID=189425 RepID=UPI002DB9C8DF|nr:DUF5348 domain-containing protein [Paenibacillus graminis]MEC0167406.1 DUF5348 domain-containing protein [Paenibacillus graminis]
MANILQVDLEKLLPKLKKVSERIQDAEDGGEYDCCDPEAMYEQAMLQRILGELTDLIPLVRQLVAPVAREGTLRKNRAGRYELASSTYFTTGSPIEFLYTYPDGDSRRESRWIYSRVEHNGSDYYIAGYPEQKMNGLWVRVKEISR